MNAPEPGRLHIAALRQLADGRMTFNERAHGLTPGYAVDDGRLAFNSHTITWLGFVGWARVDGGAATITTDGLRVLRELDARRAA